MLKNLQIIFDALNFYANSTWDSGCGCCCYNFNAQTNPVVDEGYKATQALIALNDLKTMIEQSETVKRMVCDRLALYYDYTDSIGHYIPIDAKEFTDKARSDALMELLKD